MKYCTKCGNPLLDKAVICPRCGQSPDPEVKPKEDKVMNSSMISVIVAICICIVPMLGIIYICLLIGDINIYGILSIACILSWLIVIFIGLPVSILFEKKALRNYYITFFIFFIITAFILMFSLPIAFGI